MSRQVSIKNNEYNPNKRKHSTNSSTSSSTNNDTAMNLRQSKSTIPKTKKESNGRTKKSYSTSIKKFSSSSSNPCSFPTFWTRPGVEAAYRLSTDFADDVDLWERIDGRWMDMVRHKGGEAFVQLVEECSKIGLSLSSSTGRTSTISIHENNTEAVAPTDVVSFTRKELMTIVQWKFAKGQPRYPLVKFIQSNRDEDVERYTMEAIAVANQLYNASTSSNGSGTATKEVPTIVRESIDTIATNLKGVGPATASAILSWCFPDQFVFMDDEVIEALCPNKKRTYTTSTYVAINQQCHDLANCLNAKRHTSTNSNESRASIWTPCRVGNTLWTASKLSSISGQVDPTELVTDPSPSDDGSDGQTESSPNDTVKSKNQRR